MVLFVLVAWTSALPVAGLELLRINTLQYEVLRTKYCVYVLWECRAAPSRLGGLASRPNQASCLLVGG